MRDSFIFYRSFSEAMDDLPDTEQLMLYRAIKEYSLNDNEIELSGIAKNFWKLIKPNLSANNKRFEDGKKGGRPPKTTIKISEIETSGFNNTETSGYFSEKPNKDKDVDKDKDDDDLTTAEILNIKKISKQLGFYISDGQARDFINNIDPSWLIGEFNYLALAAERIKNSDKPEYDHERLFAASWKQDFYKKGFIHWKEMQEEKARIKAKKNPPSKCSKCGGELDYNYESLICFSCKRILDYINGEWTVVDEGVA